MRTSVWVGMLAAAVAVSACSSPDYVYRGPRLPSAVQPAAVDPAAAPPPAATAAPSGGVAPADANDPLLAEGDEDALPSSRAPTATPGTIAVPRPDVGTTQDLPEDLRGSAERARARQAYDRCVLNAAVRRSEDAGLSGNPVQDTPEESCRRLLRVQDRGGAPLPR